MSVVVTTSRLILREFKPSDATDLFGLNADAEVLRFTGDTPFDSVASAQDFIENYSHYADHGYGRWGLIQKSTGNFIGWCGLKYHKDEEYTDLGYRIKRQFWGRGFATEAAMASMKLAFDEYELEMIVGRTAKENRRSVRVLEKLGMKFWKKDECHGIPEALIYRIRKNEHLSLGQGSVR
jgi:RimJ/RimL family protein N-acetyltransferase